LSSSDIWIDRHHVNLVYEILLRLSKNGGRPVDESLLVDALEREGYKFSRRELAKILLTLEILGMASVESSGSRNEFRVKIVKGGPG
jgi:hypothetical protein